ncbi:MAG: hypothetical protein C0501_13145 [Isosphaera sp.]|nr:hypothetical protein [Isosphaera sp.]
MRLAARLLLMTAVAAGAGPAGTAQTPPKPKDKTAPGDPAPLLKAVAPPAGGVRVRLPAAEGVFGDHYNTYTVTGEVPLAKKKKTDKAETVPVRVRFDNSPFALARVTEAKWKGWGYEVPKNGPVVLPELILPASQVAPKAAKGADVRVRIPNVKLSVVRTLDDSDTVFGCDLDLAVGVLNLLADPKATEPRVYFADKLVEFTAPAAAVARPGTDAPPPPDPKVSADPALVPAGTAPYDLKTADPPFLSLNGKSKYKTAAGGEVTVQYSVSSVLNWSQGVTITHGTALGCGVEFDEDKPLATVSAKALKGTACAGVVKELRLGLLTGPGLKAPKDLVLKDIPVVVLRNDSAHHVTFGAKFVEKYFADAVYTAADERLYGRVKPDLLFDPKTRPADPKPPAKKP